MIAVFLRLTVLVIAAGVQDPARSTHPELPDPAAVAAVAAHLDRVLTDADLRFARLGFRLEEAGAAVPLVAHQDDMGFTPASNMKLVSSITALRILGPDFRYETRLEGHGRQERAVFRGDLVLVGAGDPTFGARAFEPTCTAPFERMAAALEARGIREVAGRVLGDDAVHPAETMGSGWDWSDHANWYAAPVSGLCFNENCIDIVLDASGPGEAPRWRLEPDTRFVSIINRVRCVVAPESEVTFQRRLGTNQIEIAGVLPVGTRGKRDWASVPDPAAFAATVLTETLMRRGILVRGKAADRDPRLPLVPRGPVELLHTHRSPPLSEILVALNTRSQNLYAEQVVRTAGRARGGDGSMESGRAAAFRVLGELGVDTAGLVMADGSGLSRLDLVQPRHLTALLSGMARTDLFGPFRRTLPVAGVDGTLRRRFPPGSSACGRVLAKTGFVSRVVALSGYIPRCQRPPLVFSILVNDFHVPPARVRRLVDGLVECIAEHAGPAPD